MDEFSFDASSMEALERDLREAAVRLHAETDRVLPAVGALLTAKAKEIVGPHSQTIKVSDESVPGLAVVRGEAPSSPLARLYEKGNRKGRGFDSRHTSQTYTARGLTSQLSFKHRVFGGDVWVEQARFPFLRPAARALRREVTVLMNRAWDEGLAPIFRR